MTATLFSYTGDGASVVYRNLRDLDRDIVIAIRGYIDGLWQIYRQFADRDFVAEFPRRPEERFWEMYLGCSLLDMGLELRKSDPGPDLLVIKDDKRIWIEATAPTAGDQDSKDRVPEIVPISEGGTAQRVPVEQIIMRYTSAIEEKRRKFARYAERNVVSGEDVCIIAVSGAHLAPRGGYGDTIPYIARAVYPFGHAYVGFDSKSLAVVDQGYTLRESIQKHSGISIPTTAFVSREYERIAGVIFGPNGIGNTPDHLGSDLMVLRNGRSLQTYPEGLLIRGREYWLFEDASSYQLRWIDRSST